MLNEKILMKETNGSSRRPLFSSIVLRGEIKKEADHSYEDRLLDNTLFPEERVAKETDHSSEGPLLSNAFMSQGLLNKYEEDLILKDQIKRLELQLLQKDKQLLMEQKNHDKTLRQEKERSADQIQALQMRLYISETRLKNYEDALNQHIEAVSKNTSNSYKPSINFDRNRSSKKAITSPLIDRILMK